MRRSKASVIPAVGTEPMGDNGGMDAGAIVVGAGHNGLVCAAYLARAGVPTILVEARETVGGCASTVDALGARVNICNCDHSAVRTTPVLEELDLARHGLRYLPVEPLQLNVPWSGGPAWPLFQDLTRTEEALAATYPGEVEGFRRYLNDARPAVELVLELANVEATAPSFVRKVLARRGRGLETILRWSRRSAAEVLSDYFSAEALVGPALVTGPAVWGVSPFLKGTGTGALAYAMKVVAGVARPEGGSGSLPAALLAAFEHAGGKVRLGAKVTAITCDGPNVRGVRLADGTVLEAPIVVSAADPRATLVEWLTGAPPQAATMVDRWRNQPRLEGYESKLDAVVAELPSYRQVDARLAARLGFDPLVPSAVVGPSAAAIHAAHATAARGAVADRPLLLVNIPSVRDPSMMVGGAAGGHVFSLEVLYTPYSLHGGWDASAEPERWLKTYSSLVQPGWLDSVQRHRTMTPASYESEFFMPRGYATSFAGGPLAALRGKPSELTRYRTAVKGLYLSGAATFPGAGVWGASGRNAAKVVLRDTK